MARFLAPHQPVASPLAAVDGSFVCMEGLPVGDTGQHAMHAVRMSRFLPGCTLDKATQVRDHMLPCKVLAFVRMPGQQTDDLSVKEPLSSQSHLESAAERLLRNKSGGSWLSALCMKQRIAALSSTVACVA